MNTPNITRVYVVTSYEKGVGDSVLGVWANPKTAAVWLAAMIPELNLPKSLDYWESDWENNPDYLPTTWTFGSVLIEEVEVQ